jgi:hypothetical protein
VVTVAVGYWTGFRETEVNEDLVMPTSEARAAERDTALAGDASDRDRPEPAGPVSLASGEIEGADGHAGSGGAEVVAQPGGEGRVLNLSDLDVDPGPDVDVLLSSEVDDIAGAVNLGGLKGSSGDQQYPIPDSVDLREHRNVVLYCNPFTVRIAVAELDA